MGKRKTNMVITNEDGKYGDDYNDSNYNKDYGDDSSYNKGYEPPVEENKD